MHVVKRDGSHQPVQFDKITARLVRLRDREPALAANAVDVRLVAQRVVGGVFAGVSTRQLDELAAETAAYMSAQHPDYAVLAARIAVSDLHKQLAPLSFSRAIAAQRANLNAATGRVMPLVGLQLARAVERHAARLDAAIVDERDYLLSFFALRTLERSYLAKRAGGGGALLLETPQHMWMRVALGIHVCRYDAYEAQADAAGTGVADVVWSATRLAAMDAYVDAHLDDAIDTYQRMSRLEFTHATPTLYNAGTRAPQMSSCFLMPIEDSLDDIYETLHRCARISKSGGGIGLAASSVRAAGTPIAGTNGRSNGLVPMLRVYNDTSRYVDQGGGKRKGAFAVYLEPWHADVCDFLRLRLPNGKEAERVRDLFYALWVPDEFMRRVASNGAWSLFCPHDAPGLDRAHGAAFDALYRRYEATPGLARRVMPAQQLWIEVCRAQAEGGVPFMLYKDRCNALSNQNHLGTIRCSNLCTEIVEYSAPGEVAVCNLASLALPRFMDRGAVDHARLAEATRVLVRNLNRIIDHQFYPVEEARVSNLRHRPIGIGIQGLADACVLARCAFDSTAAQALGDAVFRTVYLAALDASADLAAVDGPHPSYAGSRVSRGILHFDDYLVGERDDDLRISRLFGGVAGNAPYGDCVTVLRSKIARHGVRNSLLVAQMPTASTSQILGNSESIDPYVSNVFSRAVASGDFMVVSAALVRDLEARGAWTDAIRQSIIQNDGSVAHLGDDVLPADVRAIYKTAGELDRRRLIDMAASRGAYIDQSQSFNVYMPRATPDALSAMHMYGWRQGLKTGMYYLRTTPAAKAVQVTVAPTCARGGGSADGCTSCGS